MGGLPVRFASTVGAATGTSTAATISGLSGPPAFSFVGSGTATVNNATTLNVPAVAATLPGDLILIFVAIFSATGVITRPSGFTGLDENLVGHNSGSHKSSSMYKLAATGDNAGNFAITTSAAAYMDAVIYVIRGVDQTNPVLHHNQQTDTGGYTTTLNPSSLIVANATDATVYAYTGVSLAASGANTATLPGTLSNVQVSNNASLGDVVGVGWGINVTSPGNATSATAVDFISFAVDINPGGDDILVATFTTGTATITGIADGTNTYVKLASMTGAYGTAELWAASGALTTSPLTVTATWSASTAFPSLCVVEEQGLVAAAGLLDVTNTTTGTSASPAGTTLTSGATYETQMALLIGGSALTAAITSGWVQLTSAAMHTRGYGLAALTVGLTVNNSVSWAQTSSTAYGLLQVALKPTSAVAYSVLASGMINTLFSYASRGGGYPVVFPPNGNEATPNLRQFVAVLPGGGSGGPPFQSGQFWPPQA